MEAEVLAIQKEHAIEEALKCILIESTTVPKFLFVRLCEHFGWLCIATDTLCVEIMVQGIQEISEYYELLVHH